MGSKGFLKASQKFWEHLIHPSKEASKILQLLAKHVRHYCFQKLLLFLIFLKKFCIYKHELSYRDGLARINFTSTKTSIKKIELHSFVPIIWNTCYLAMKENCYSGVICLTISIGSNETMAKVCRTLIDWRVQPQDFSRLINLYRNKT